MNRQIIFDYVKDKYGVTEQYLWKKYPLYAVLRHDDNLKWFAIIMNVLPSKLGLDGEETVDVIDIKCDPIMIGAYRLQKGFLQAYHMNKEHWITVLLDGTVSEEEIFSLIDLSFDITKKK